MKMILSISVWAVLLVVAPSPCFALWQLDPVSRERAKEMGMELRSTAAGPNHIRVELELKPEGELKDFGRVDLHFGEGDNPPLTAPLREDRSKPGRVVVNFTAKRTQLDKIKLWVIVPFMTGGTAYELRVNDFVELGKNR